MDRLKEGPSVGRYSAMAPWLKADSRYRIWDERWSRGGEKKKTKKNDDESLQHVQKEREEEGRGEKKLKVNA